MAQKSKAYRAAAAKIEDGKYYTPDEAVALARETGSEPLLATEELSARCGRFAALTGKRIAHRIVDCGDGDGRRRG